MQKRTREILALVLLAVFALVGVGAMGYYILVGHNWNVTASNIDDTIGQMEGYTVVLYEGTRPDSRISRKSAGSTYDSAGPSRSDEPEATFTTASAQDDAKLGDISSIAASYREKGADVFVADTGSLSRYAEPYIVDKGGKRLGFLAATKVTLRSAIRADSRYLSRHGAEYTVALTDDPALCDVAADGLIGSVSVIICDDPKGKAPNGEYRGGTYCVSAPEVGKVGAVIISPSGVFSKKTVESASES